MKLREPAQKRRKGLPPWLPALAIFGCASLSVPAANTPWLDVPFVRQVKAGCGAAAVAMVVQYWAREYPGLGSAAVDTERINRLLPASAKGIQGRRLQQFLEKRGFAAFIFNGELQDLAHHFQKGRPVIVCFAPRGPHAPLHYAVVDGIDGKEIWLNDPARGKLIHEDREHFVAEWKETGNWALLAVPRQAQ